MRRAAHLPPLKRVGHKGADHVAPGNTLESFERALEMGVDMIEFDVLPLPDGRLVLAHDFADARSRRPLTLDEGLDHFAGDAYAGVELDVDMKLPGCEREVAEGLADRALTDRAIASSMYLQSLDRLATLAPTLPRGWSVPRVRRDYTRSALAPVAYAYARVLRRRLPRSARALLADGRIQAVMAHWLLVSPRLVEAVHATGGHLYVWTVDDAARIATLERLGVDGVVTNDPRLFG
jgi:glycerophosphoryl diester phosphodiesterase